MLEPTSLRFSHILGKNPAIPVFKSQLPQIPLAQSLARVPALVAMSSNPFHHSVSFDQMPLHDGSFAIMLGITPATPVGSVTIVCPIWVVEPPQVPQIDTAFSLSFVPAVAANDPNPSHHPVIVDQISSHVGILLGISHVKKSSIFHQAC